jgi:hypothetical protein
VWHPPLSCLLPAASSLPVLACQPGRPPALCSPMCGIDATSSGIAYASCPRPHRLLPALLPCACACSWM